MLEYSDAFGKPKIVNSTAMLPEQQYLEDGRKAGNTATTSNAQVVQKLAVLPRDFSLGDGTLTPTMKLKRNVAAKMYAELIETMY